MFLARIQTDKRIYNIYSDNINDANENLDIYGFYYEDGKFYPLNDDVFKEFDKFKLGKNFKKVGIHNDGDINYDVLLDLDTNLKHFFYNGKEDIKLFIHNFKPIYITSFKNKHDNKKKASFMSLVCAQFAVSFGLGIVIGEFSPIKDTRIITVNNKTYVLNTNLNNTPELNADNIKSIINVNPNISESDKQILFDDQMLNWASTYINMNKEYAAELYNIILPNFKIIDKSIEGNVLGYRSYDQITIDKQKINDQFLYTDVLRHEFCHLLQPYNKTESLLFEGFTDLMAKEFLNKTTDAQEPKYLKILMEIIGSEPVIQYQFTGNINIIEQQLQNYLPENKIYEFLQYCRVYDRNDEIYAKVESILNEAFYNKYGIQLNDSFLIQQFTKNHKTSEKIHYFNEPTDEIPIVTRYAPSFKYTKVFDKDGSFTELRILNGYEEITQVFPKDILITSKTLEEAQEQIESTKSK